MHQGGKNQAKQRLVTHPLNLGALDVECMLKLQELLLLR
jgi:hypothetical protein